VSVKESTITSFQASVAKLNKLIEPPHLTKDQKSKLKTVLGQG
jgi:hypothetical protein